MSRILPGRALAVALALTVAAAGCAGDDELPSGNADAETAAASERAADDGETGGSTDAMDDADEGGAEEADNTGVPAQVDPASLPAGETRDFGPAPDWPDGPLAEPVLASLDAVMGPRLAEGVFDERSRAAIGEIAGAGDARLAWLLSDMLRIAREPVLRQQLADAATELTGAEIDTFNAWGDLTDRLIAWDVPAPPDYLSFKRNAYLLVEPRWDALFVEDSDLDWRLVSWGGVLMDGRAWDETDVPCNCIPAADNPMTTDVAGGDEWLDDDTIVFGVEINGEPRAYPRSIMEVREMVNDTLGGRDFAMPYCTLCGSAQVFFTDEVPDGIARPVLRTSGLLSRSNKVMFDIESFSIFDTFTGRAVSGPLLAAGVELDQHSVITTTWGQWKQDHPTTSVLAIELALGRPDSDLRNTRDADGPIFPIGDVDPRLPVQEDVLGVFTSDGTPIAFHVASAVEALERGEFIEVDGIRVVLDGGGVRAFDTDGNDLGGHQAFWFAWSQFHPETELWPS